MNSDTYTYWVGYVWIETAYCYVDLQVLARILNYYDPLPNWIIPTIQWETTGGILKNFKWLW